VTARALDLKDGDFLIPDEVTAIFQQPMDITKTAASEGMDRPHADALAL
jgi:hypothetical protein